MNKKTLLALIIAALILLFLSYFQFGKGLHGPFSFFESKTSQIGKQAGDKLSKASWPPVEATAVAAAPGFLSTKMESPERFEAFKKALVDMGQCLNMQVGILDPQAEISFEYLNSLISADLGEVVEENQEWTLTDLRTSTGEIRRIFVENIIQDESVTQHILKYFKVGSEGQLEEIPLSPEQIANPTETLLASLEKDGEVVARSAAKRIFYQNGDGLLLVERNGKIYSFQLPHDEKIFKCSGADAAQTMKCICE